MILHFEYARPCILHSTFNTLPWHRTVASHRFFCLLACCRLLFLSLSSSLSTSLVSLVFFLSILVVPLGNTMWRGLDDMAISPFLLASSATASPIVRCIPLGLSAFESRLSIIESGCRYYTRAEFRVRKLCAFSHFPRENRVFGNFFCWGQNPQHSGHLSLILCHYANWDCSRRILRKYRKPILYAPDVNLCSPNSGNLQAATNTLPHPPPPSSSFINTILCTSI